MTEDEVIEFAELLSDIELPKTISINGEKITLTPGINGSINNQGECDLRNENFFGRKFEFTVHCRKQDIPCAIQLYENISHYYRMFIFTDKGMLFSVNLSLGDQGDRMLLGQQLKLSTRNIDSRIRQMNTQKLIKAIGNQHINVDDKQYALLAIYDKRKNIFVKSSPQKFLTDFIKVGLIKGHFSQNKGYCIPSLQNSETERQHRIISPREKLKRRISKEFQTKKLIGDITINDEEYSILIEYLQRCFSIHLFNSSALIKEPMFCVALAQIGIRFYDGDFWGHVADALSIRSLNANQQRWMGESFISTLKLNGKYILGKNDWRSTILMHSFVTNHYAGKLFDFLFAYYKIDLERDISRNNKESMDALFEAMLRNDNTNRTYCLVQQTADAIRMNPRGCKVRIYKFLRMMDQAFWGDLAPTNSQSRMTRLFWEWKEASKEFSVEFSRCHSGGFGGGKKSFSAPYIKFSFQNHKFYLKLPQQIIHFSDIGNVRWKIALASGAKELEADIYEQGVTGYKTEPASIELSDEDVFSSIVIELFSDSLRLRPFKINAEEIRFFDKDGDYLRTDDVPAGEAFSVTSIEFTPISDALVDAQTIRSFVLSCYEFQYGDIVRLPDGKPLSIGKKVEEGLLHRGVVQDVFAVLDQEKIPVYKTVPSVLIKMKKTRSAGAAIHINGTVFRMFERQPATEIELDDRSGETGYFMSLVSFGINKNGIYDVFVDVPNDRANRHWHFVFINGMDYTFEDAPYIFQPYGSVKFSAGITVWPLSNEIDPIKVENTFNFEMKPDCEELLFSMNLGSNKIELAFCIPMLSYRLENEEWQNIKPPEIWHSDFPRKICFRYPCESIKLRMDDMDISEETAFQEELYRKSKSENMFVCDTTRFLSWFGRDTPVRRIFLEVPGSSIPFVDVVTRSVVASKRLEGDFINDILYGKFDIIGKSNYYADIRYGSEIIAEKVPIEQGEFHLSTVLKSGKYDANIYEEEDDDTGFGMPGYFLIDKFSTGLLNPFDLQGKNILIRYIKQGEDSNFKISLNCTYKVSALERVRPDDRNNYYGMLSVESGSKSSEASIRVLVEFYNLKRLKYAHIRYLDDDEYEVFLYDEYRHTIVKEPEKGLTRAQEYRRYQQSLFPEDYVFGIEFI